MRCKNTIRKRPGKGGGVAVAVAVADGSTWFDVAGVQVRRFGGGGGGGGGGGASFDSDRLGEIARTVDVAFAQHGDVVGQQLHRNHRQNALNRTAIEIISEWKPPRSTKTGGTRLHFDSFAGKKSHYFQTEEESLVGRT